MIAIFATITACITGCLCVYNFMVLRRGRPVRHGNALTIILGVLALILWTFALGFERAIAICAVQIMTAGVALSCGFALMDAKRINAEKSDKIQ